MGFFRRTTDYPAVVDRLARAVPPNKKIAQDEAELIKAGRPAAEAVAYYLLECGKGQVPPGWWNNAIGLVMLIGKIPSGIETDLLETLARADSPIAEYDRYVAVPARDQLYGQRLQEAPQSDVVSAVDANAVLHRTENITNPKKRLEALLDLRLSAEVWSDKDKAFYYFMHAGAISVLFPDSTAHLAFYAAQVHCNPDPTAFGWGRLDYGDAPIGKATAAKLHDAYPLPTTVDEIANYRLSPSIDWSAASGSEQEQE